MQQYDCETYGKHSEKKNETMLVSQLMNVWHSDPNDFTWFYISVEHTYLSRRRIKQVNENMCNNKNSFYKYQNDNILLKKWKVWHFVPRNNLNNVIVCYKWKQEKKGGSKYLHSIYTLSRGKERDKCIYWQPRWLIHLQPPNDR
jgi:hypothetical protein